MRSITRDRVARRYVFLGAAGASLIVVAGVFWAHPAPAAQDAARRATSSVPYANMPAIAPIGVRVDKYFDVPDFAKGPDVDPAKGYRTQKLGAGLYMITDGAYQSMFLTHEDGVVVVDAPPSYASHIPKAIAEVTDKPITHLVYSHYHVDHIAGARRLGGRPIIIAQKETNRLLARDNDPDRPPATVTFDDQYRLSVGSQVLELSYHGTAHAPGNIFIYAPEQRTLMVGGHVARTGTRADVMTQLAFMEDLRNAAETALKTTTPGEGLNAGDRSSNPWALFDHYIDRVALACVNELTPKWSTRLAAYDVYIWDQCLAMEQSLRID